MSERGAIVPFPDLKSIEAEAAKWLVVLDDENVSPQDRAAFNSWRDQSAQHREVFARLAAQWGEFERLSALNDYAATLGTAPAARNTNWEPVLSRRSMLVASGVAALLGTAAYVRPWLFGESNPPVVRTAIGERKTAKLNDGSIIELNTDSLVAVSYSAEVREIHLVHGEVYFDVAADATRPFLVYAGTGAVRAVGTAFTVRVLEKKLNVVVEEGSVALLPNMAAPVTAGRAPPREPRSVEVQAGQDAVFADKVEQVRNLNLSELNRKLSWRNGILSFSGDPLSEVLADMSRYADVKIEITDDSLRNLPIDGYFKIGKLDTMLEALEVMAHVKVEHIGPHKIRLSRRT